MLRLRRNIQLVQPEIANRLRARKVTNIEKVKPQIIASGNLGCITQIGAEHAFQSSTRVELVDWAMGGPLPDVLKGCLGLG